VVPRRVSPHLSTRPEPHVTGAARFEVLVPPPADGSTRARLGRLHLSRGVVETPTFMPVGTNATIKALHPDEIEETGAQIILANTYHLYLRPGHERIARLGGLHEFMSWPHPILTDSGGFQVVSLGDLNVIDDDGVTFQSHHDGSRHRFTAERSMEIQAALGADVAVAFDQPVPPSSTDLRDVAIATERTHRWALRSLEAHRRPDQALFGVIQGGLDPALRRQSTAFIAGLPFDGLNIGGLAGDETPAQREAVLDLVIGARRGSARPLPDGPRLAGGPARGGPSRRRPVRLRAAGEGGPQRPALDPWRPAQHSERALPRRPGAGPGGLPMPALPALQPGLPRPPVPCE